MPMATKEEQRNYQREWRSQRRLEWIQAHGPCVHCGASEELEVDHIDHKEKLLNPSYLWSLSRTNPKRIAELAKCQVLCKRCHDAKTLEQLKTYRGYCRQGHQLVQENVYLHPGSRRRECLICKKTRRRANVHGGRSSIG
jgi:hypothetical protein